MEGRAMMELDSGVGEKNMNWMVGKSKSRQGQHVELARMQEA